MRTKLDERGLTLMELTVVSVLATIVMLGLTGFYLSSQFTWIDGSAKALTQREGTLLLETLRDSVHTAHRYVADPFTHQLSLYKFGQTTAFYVFRWDADTDSMMRAGPEGNESVMLQSKVRRFEFAPQADDAIVQLDALELVSVTGQTVFFSSSFALLNREGL